MKTYLSDGKRYNWFCNFIGVGYDREQVLIISSTVVPIGIITYEPSAFFPRLNLYLGTPHIEYSFSSLTGISYVSVESIVRRDQLRFAQDMRDQEAREMAREITEAMREEELADNEALRV